MAVSPEPLTNPTQPQGTTNWRLNRWLYLLVVGGGTVMAYLLAYAPFKLPVCLFRLMTGLPCMGCGMTRAIVAAAHGDFHSAFAWHPMGLALFLALWGGAVFVAYELVTHRLFPWAKWLQRWSFALAWALFVSFLLIWVLRISYYRYGQWLPIPLKVPL